MFRLCRPPSGAIAVTITASLVVVLFTVAVHGTPVASRPSRNAPLKCYAWDGTQNPTVNCDQGRLCIISYDNTTNTAHKVCESQDYCAKEIAKRSKVYHVFCCATDYCNVNLDTARASATSKTTPTSAGTSAASVTSPRSSTEPATHTTTGHASATSQSASDATPALRNATISDNTDSTTHSSDTTYLDTTTFTGAQHATSSSLGTVTSSAAVGTDMGQTTESTTTTTTTSQTTAQPPSPSSSTTTSSKSNTVMIVSVAVSVVVLCIILLAIIGYCLYRRKKKRASPQSSTPPTVPTVITNPKRRAKTPKTPKPSAGFRATGPNAPFHYEAKDHHFRGPAKFTWRIEDPPEPTSTETAMTLQSKSEHVEFDKDLNEVYEIGSEVEQYLDGPHPKKARKKRADRAIRE